MADIWSLLENPPIGCDEIADLYSWSLNYDAGKGPFTLFLDLTGWSAENIGEPMYQMRDASLGYLELDKLADALRQYADRPYEAHAYIEALLAAEGDEAA